MQIKYGIQNEAFKLVGGSKWIFNPNSIDGFGRAINLVTGQNDTASFQVVIWTDSEYALNVGESAWFSQKGHIPVLRLQVNSKLKVKTVNIIDMHEDDNNYLCADALLTSEVLELAKDSVRSVWIELDVPAGTNPGSYSTEVSLYLGGMFVDEKIIGTLTADIEVAGCELNNIRDNKFHLDLWQHCSNIARKHEVKLWSDDHFAVLENYIRSLGELGQKAVTLIVSEIPWAGQGCYYEQRTEANLFEYSIIPITKNADGLFAYDFTKMQRYIDLCARYGIDRELELFGLANIWGGDENGFIQLASDYPDGIRLRYFDMSDSAYKYMKTADEIDMYITALEHYLIATGQIDRIRLAADEPGDVVAYRRSLDHIKKIAPSFKCKAAINHAEFISEFGEEVYDFVPSIGSMCAEYDKIKEYKRTMSGKRFLWYVCCGPEYPNTFLMSNLTESYFIGVLTSYAGFDGFLRWNYTVWNDNPRTDIRYGNWHAGDTNFVYPSGGDRPLLTLRYKALKRGIELYELLERLHLIGDAAELDAAYAYVVREKDIRRYYAVYHKLDEICSTDYNDYMALKRFLLEKLAE